jgi:benzoylformate decarboxylase
MNFLKSRTRHVTFKRTKVLDDAVVSSIVELSAALMAVPSGRLAIVVDYAVGADKATDALGRLATELDADIYAAPFHVQGVVDPKHPSYRGQLPPTTAEINDTLSRYDTMLLVGDKVDTFTYNGKQALPPDLRVIQITPATRQLGFDWPVDLAVVGDIRATLEGIVSQLGLDNGAPATVASAPDVRALDAKYRDSGPHASDALILGVLKRLDASTHVITEGSSEDALVQEMAVGLGFRNVHFSPRGGGLGWAMPLGTGISLATGEHSVCFVGDGGSLFSIHSIWTASKHEIPIIFVCFVNREYRILKELWCNEMGTKIADTPFIGLDFKDPDVDLMGIARALGARTDALEAVGDIDRVIGAALGHGGPSFILINREHS